MSDPKTLPNISLSTLAKEHEINKPNCVASTSGFKIPSLFGNKEGSIDTGSQSISLIKDSTSSTKPSIDLSSAILTKEERALKSVSPEHGRIKSSSLDEVDKRVESSQQLISSIDLLITSSDNVFDEVIKNEKTKPSAFGHVLCRQWKENRNKASKSVKFTPTSPVKRDHTGRSSQIQPFLFDVPSPDDIIIAAQSKVFGRRLQTPS